MKKVRDSRVPLTPGSLSKRKCRLLLQEKWSTRSKYGNPRRKTPAPCERIQTISCRKGKTLSPYQMAFIAHYGHWHSADCLSHQCGVPYSKDSLCISPTHLIPESTKDNSERKRCHNLIKQWEKAFRKQFPNRPRRGPLFVKDVPCPASYVDKRTRKRRSNRCRHEPKCFINYGLVRE